MANDSERGPNWLQIRERIDADKTLDKNTPPEPAMATFGTDDEAAGQYTAPEDIARSAGPEATLPGPSPKPVIPGWAYFVGGLAVLVIGFILLTSLVA
ncbi:MAG TPA: hypothetical protein VHL31_13150 [Geminicoccus sp.]|jgi:hypothetical protein|uniref:hypothetical protein n=1 Tax=Geminicoccus sp. TaxID=2024832 RepID=UPI002E30582D|nr:hypothetical protein [Geminicoccus sp.]HEX2527228.1 hypothetical protein [Geminicoccus sp.]